MVVYFMYKYLTSSCWT